jgi:hypothetical protein
LLATSSAIEKAMLSQPAAQRSAGTETENLEVSLPVADFAPSSSHSQSHVFCSACGVGACSSGQRLAATDLEDIGDGDGVLGGLPLRVNDCDGRPGHACGVVPAVS